MVCSRSQYEKKPQSNKNYIKLHLRSKVPVEKPCIKRPIWNLPNIRLMLWILRNSYITWFRKNKLNPKTVGNPVSSEHICHVSPHSHRRNKPSGLFYGTTLGQWPPFCAGCKDYRSEYKRGIIYCYWNLQGLHLLTYMWWVSNHIKRS